MEKLKVFISWSGQLSGKIAKQLRDWFPSVIQTIRPYLSSEDLDKGLHWNSEITRELKTCSYGIICATADNLDSQWLNFEAGALSKSFDDTGRVSPFLVGIDRSDITGPLAQFQSTIYERDDVLQLMRSMNTVSESPLEQERLLAVFNKWWPELQSAIDPLLVNANQEAPPVHRKSDDVINEVLLLTRAQQKALSEMMTRLEPSAVSHKSPEMVSAIDFNEVAFLLGRIRGVAQYICTSGRGAEMTKLVQMRGLTHLLADVLSPLVSDQHCESIAKQYEATLMSYEANAINNEP